MKRMLTTRSAGFALSISIVLSATAHAQGVKPATLLNPNVVSEADLAKLPHLTPALAQTIVSRRPFRDMRPFNTLLQSLTPEQRTEVYGRLFVPVNLNTATRPEFELIPGVTARLVREFLEYRPYKDMEQFRREIGKYVSREEVARLERYMTLK